MRELRPGDCTERIRVESPVGSAWAVVATMAASVLPGGALMRRVQPIFPELAVTAPCIPYQVRVFHRTDLSSGMRIRWGTQSLAIETLVDPDNRRHELRMQACSVPSYVDVHAAALAAIANEGFAVTFSEDSSVGYDAPTDTMPVPTDTTTVIGYAKWIPGGKPMAFTSETLVPSTTPKLLFVPTTIGQMPAIGSLLSIGADAYALETRDDCAPDGRAIGGYMMVKR